jgi:hypothetical protein
MTFFHGKTKTLSAAMLMAMTNVPPKDGNDLFSTIGQENDIFLISSK